MNVRKTKKYWDERALKGGSPQDLVLADVYLEEYEANTRKILKLFPGKVLDVGCGFGRLANAFDPKDYTGLDFSDEMIKLAKKKNPNHFFNVWSIHDDFITDDKTKYDVIFEAISLSSFEMTPEQFRDRFKGLAKVIICFETHEFTIFYL